MAHKGSTFILLARIFVVVCSVGRTMHAPSPGPMLELAGDIRVVMLLDIHKSLSKNGTCEDIDIEVIQVGQAAIWTYDWMKKNEEFKGIGPISMEVYDTCGSPRAAMEILARVVTESADPTARRLAGVISYTREAVERRIDEYLSLMGYLHVALSELGMGVDITPGGSSLHVPSPSVERLKALASAARQMHWERISVVIWNETESTRQANAFMDIAKDFDICVTSTNFVQSLADMFKIKFQTPGVLAFFSELPENLAQFENVSNEHWLLISGMDDLPFLLSTKKTGSRQDNLINSPQRFNNNNTDNSGRRRNLFIAVDIINRTEALIADFESTTTTISSSLEFLGSVLGCGHNGNSCKEIIDAYFDMNVHYSNIVRGKEAFMGVAKGIKLMNTAKCFDFKIVPCGLKVGHFNFSRNDTALMQTSPANACPTGLPLSLLSITERQEFDVVGSFQDDKFTPVDEKKISGISSLIPPSRCLGGCEQCSTCLMSRSSPIRAAILQGDVYVGGVFSVRDAKGHISAERIFAMEAFLWSMDKFGKQILGNRNVGAFAVESGGSSRESLKIVNSIEACSISPSSNGIPQVAKHQIAGYLDVSEKENLIEQDHFKDLDNGKPVVSISRFGLRTYNRVAQGFWSTKVANMLKTLQWTYPTIIWSDTENDYQFRTNFERTLRKNNICVAASHIVPHEKNHPSVSLEYLEMSTTTASRTVVVMSDYPATLRFMRDYEKRYGNQSAATFMFLPWNMGVLRSLSDRVSLGAVFVDLKQETNFNFELYLKQIPFSPISRNPWVVDLYKSQCDDKCNKPPDARKCWERFVDDVQLSLSSHVIHITENILFDLKYGLKLKCKDDITDCDKEAVLQGLVDPAKLPFPLDVSNIQLGQNGKTFRKKVGQFDSKGQLNLIVSDVRIYNEEGEIIPTASVCEGWCPACDHCLDAVVSPDTYLYTPGDIVVLGVFPIHEQGGEAKCGELYYRGYIDAESFLYAVKNIHKRYPEILPNVTVGSLVIDSCNDLDKALQQILNFEGCVIGYNDNENPTAVLSPKMVLGYIGDFDAHIQTSLLGVIGRHKRPLLVSSPIIDKGDNPLVLSTAKSDDSVSEAVVDLLLKSNWTYVSVVASENGQYIEHANIFQRLASQNEICLAGIYTITKDNSSVKYAQDGLHRNRASQVIVTFLNPENTSSLFGMQKLKMLRRIWIIAGEEIYPLDDHTVYPLGSLVFAKPKFSHDAFETYLQGMNISSPDTLPWSDEFNHGSKPQRKRDEKHQAARTITTVDSLMHGFHEFYTKKCPENAGLCENMGSLSPDAFAEGIIAETRKANFLSDTGEVVAIDKTDCFLPGGTYDLMNIRKELNGSLAYVKVAGWDGKLRMLSNARFQFYDSYEYERHDEVRSTCTVNCECVNALVTEPVTQALVAAGVYGDLMFYKTSGELMEEPWAIVLLVIASTGLFIGLAIIFYIISKLCVGSLSFKNVDVGLVLILADILLFLSVLPFVFTPTALGCGLQYLLPSIAYAICFGICLTKAMTIYEFNSVGFGGEVSRLNTFVIVLFMVGVQVAISTQFWFTHDTGAMLLTETTVDGAVLYACNFEKRTFVIYLSYVLFLLFLCSLYSFSLRDDRRNFHETRYLLACSIMCVIVWVAWVLVLFLTERDFAEPSICVGIVLCASIILGVLFFPKLRHLYNPKHYSLRHKKTSKVPVHKSRNGFDVEGPYTLPGTVHTKEKPYANSIVALNSEFFY